MYVGKAANLRSRVPAYFAEEQGSTEREFLREQIADLETIIVPNEAQALLLENTLIVMTGDNPLISAISTSKG